MEHEEKLWNSGALFNKLGMMKALEEDVLAGREIRAWISLLFNIVSWPVRDVMYHGDEELGVVAVGLSGP